MTSTAIGPRPSIARDPGDHKVTFSVTIAKSMLVSVDNDTPVIESSKKGKKLAVYEAPKAQNYFHLEYKLMPNDMEPVRTDVVMYGMAAKIYNDNDSKVLKTWREGDKLWIAWVQSVSMWINKEVLLKLFDHTMELRIWDSKEKVSTRARFDRPKAFRLPAGKEGEEGDSSDNLNVKALVMKQSLSYLQLHPKDSNEERTGEMEAKRLSKTASGNMTRVIENTLSANARATTAPTAGATTTPAPSTSVSRLNDLAKVQVNVIPVGGSYYSSLAELAGLNQPLSENDIQLMTEAETSKKREGLERERRVKKKLQVDELEKEVSKPRVSDTRTKKRTKKDEQKIATISAYTRTHGIVAVRLRMSLLFAGSKTVTKRLPSPVLGIEDLLLTVSLDKPLLSEEQKKDLNPMVIKLCSASNLPNKPLSHAELNERCAPVFAQYQFFKQPVHRTSGLLHTRNAFWDDINVVLLGTLNKGSLQEYLQGPPLQVELHDRDRKCDSKKAKSELFGDHPEDEMISNISLVAGRRTTHNPFESKQHVWNPYGIAKLDLSDLLLGQRYLYMTVPVRSCATPDPTIGHDRPGGAIIGYSGSVDGPEEEPLPAANYIEAGCELKVKIDVAHPLTTPAEVRKRIREPSTVAVPSECPFTRVIYIFDYTNGTFLRDLQNEITRINARALELLNLPGHVIDAALSTYKLSEDQKVSKTLDILTGFQIIDGVHHIFVLEGLRDEGIGEIVGNLPLDETKHRRAVKVLYKSDMTFSERLYASLDVDFCRVRLHDSLTNITQKPLLYVRDIVPRPCFEGLTRLDKILQSTKLRDVVKNDLFPTPEMVVSISREFGVPLAAEDFGEMDTYDNVGLLDEQTLDEPERSKPERRWTPLQLSNPEYLVSLKNRENESRNFIMENILDTRTKEPKSKRNTVAVDKNELPNQMVHNYSTQTLNSTELSKQKLKDILKKDSDGLYTYCAGYNSASIPVHDVTVEDEKRTKEIYMLDSKDFIFPGSLTALEANRHPLRPDEARVDELQKPWRENVLHANILKPTVDRMVFPWKHRDKDMDVITQPADPEYVGTIHLHGDPRQQELRGVNNEATRHWQSRVVVDDLRFRTHRCLPKTELATKSDDSALSKLEDILKDPAQKYSLNAPKLKLDKIPALAVTTSHPPEKDTTPDTGSVNNRGYVPGPFEERSWLVDGNRVPVRNDGAKTPPRDDFKLVFRERTVRSRRAIEPLSPKEKNTHLFST